MLTVRCGAFQPELERAFLEDLARLRREDPLAPAAVVAPSRAMADRLQRLACVEGGLSLLGVHFHTFRSLARAVLAESGFAARPIGVDATERLIDSLLGAGARRLAASYRSSLKDLMDAGVEGRAGELVAEGLAGDGDSAAGLADLLSLLERLEGELESRGLASSSRLVRAAAEAAPASRLLGGMRAILYYGFYDLTGVQADFFEAVADAHPVTLYFPYRKGHPAFAFADRFFETKLHRGGRSPQALEPAPGARALGTALDALFSPGRVGSPRPGGLRLVSASGERDESWRAAKEVLRLVEEEGYAYSEIAVVARALEPYREALSSALRESGVPFGLGSPGPLLKRPAARACLTLLTLARRDFPALSVLDLAESPFFRGRPGPRWRALVRRLRIARGWLQWEGKLGAARQGGEEDASALWELLLRWRGQLAPEGRRGWAAWARHAVQVVEDSLDGGGDPAFEEALRVLRGLAELEVLGEEVSWADFLEAAEEALARAALPEPRAHAGVRVLDAMQARGESFRAVFLLGLAESGFPRPVREDPLLRDEARAALRDAGGYWISPKLAGHEEEKLLFWLAAGAASERLYASFPRADEEGRARIPSIFLLELCRAAQTTLTEAGGLERVSRLPAERLSNPALADYLSPEEAAIAAALRGAISPELSALMEELNRPGAPGRFDGVAGPGVSAASRALAGGLSPSAVETLARCRFQFFASRLLGLEEEEEAFDSGELAPALRGQIYHEILADFYGRAARPEGPFPEDELRAAHARVFERYGWRALGLYPLLWEILRDRMLESLRRFLAADWAELAASGLRPSAAETPLSGELAGPLPAGLAGQAFRGRPDRIDAGPSGWRVVDYKSRWKGGDLAKAVAAGKSWQAPLYIELAARKAPYAGAPALGAVFCSIEDGERYEYPAAEHARLRPALVEELAALVESVREGRFPVSPAEGEFGHCRWCAFGTVCRKAHGPTARRSAAA